MMKPKQLVVNDLRECSSGVITCGEGQRYILGTKSDHMYVDKLVYSDLHDIIKLCKPLLRTITINDSFVLMGVTNQPESANANHTAVIFIENNTIQRGGKSTRQYTIRCFVTGTFGGNPAATLYYDSNRRNVCSINGYTNEIKVIERLSNF